MAGSGVPGGGVMGGGASGACIHSSNMAPPGGAAAKVVRPHRKTCETAACMAGQRSASTLRTVPSERGLRLSTSSNSLKESLFESSKRPSGWENGRGVGGGMGEA